MHLRPATNEVRRAVPRAQYHHRRRSLYGAALVIAALLIGDSVMAEKGVYVLPEAGRGADNHLNDILRQRRTLRAFAPQPLTLSELAQLLWAAQGISSRGGLRTAPSAGALYPLELHLVSASIADLPAGHYRYDPAHHALRTMHGGDHRHALAAAALQQDWIAEAPAIFIISAVDSRTTRRYGRRGTRYVHIEAGHAGQNLLLQATALGLASATVGAFDDEQLHLLLNLPEQEWPLLILPVGHAD
jgi:SagB-type dehydrogenase family enzyme